MLRHRSCAYVFVNVCSVAYHLILRLMHVPWRRPSWTANHSETFVTTTAFGCLNGRHLFVYRVLSLSFAWGSITLFSRCEALTVFIDKRHFFDGNQGVCFCYCLMLSSWSYLLISALWRTRRGAEVSICSQLLPIGFILLWRPSLVMLQRNRCLLWQGLVSERTR